MEEKIIEKNIIIEASDLNSNVKENIRKNLNKLIGTSSKKDGYIVDIIKIIKHTRQ